LPFLAPISHQSARPISLLIGWFALAFCTQGHGGRVTRKRRPPARVEIGRCQGLRFARLCARLRAVKTMRERGCRPVNLPRLCCLDFHGVDARRATRSAFKDIMDIKVLKTRCSSERHNSSATWATRRPWRVFTRMFVAHGRQRSLNRKCPRHLSRDVFVRVDKNLRV
jgi:hypothetical protein